MDKGVYKKSKVAVIGCEELLESFMVSGIDVYITSSDGLESMVDNVVNEGYNIIFVTEEVVNRLKEKIEEIILTRPACISVIPSVKKREGVAENWIRNVVRRGLGVDINIPSTQS